MKTTSNRCRTNVFDELDRGLNALMRGVVTSDAVASDDPRLSLVAYEDRYVIECDLPGVSRENVSLQIENDVLTISGTRTATAEEDNVRVLMNERPGQEFSRRLQLAKDIDASAIDAELANGVLRITIPKRSEVLPRRIEIRRPQAPN